MRQQSISASKVSGGVALRWVLAVGLSVVCLWTWAQDLAAVPPLQTRVTDTIGMLTPEQRTALENVLKEQEDRTGNQIAVLLMGSTAPEAIEQFSIRVADAWKLGRKGIDDGVILVVARDNTPALRRLRIESGRGVQGSLTDAQSKRILEEVIAPHFRQNDFYGGLAAGVSSIAALVAKEQLPAPARQEARQDEGLGSWLPFLLFALFFIVPMLMRGGRRRNRLGGNDWGRNAGIILGSGIGSSIGSRGGFGGGGGGFGGGGGGFSGGGGGFDGGGASGNW